MNKPFSVAYEDFKQDMAALINNSGLPALVIESILQNYLTEIRAVAVKQYQADKAQYEKSNTDSNTQEH